MAVVADAYVTCPRCGVHIPCPAATKPTPEGLTVALDMALVEDHVDMHTRCTCDWDVAIERLDPQCEVHGA